MKKLLKNIRYLLEYTFFMLFISIVKLFGIDKAGNIFAYIGRKIGPYLKATKIARNNIEENLKLSNSDKIIDNLWDNFGRFLGEFPFIPSLSEQEIENRIVVEGIENIQSLLDSNRPCLICAGHFANWEVMMRLAKIVGWNKFAVVYRHANNPYVDDFILSHRRSLNVKMIMKGQSGIKDMIQTIKAGYTIALLVDQKMKKGIKVPFFGKEVRTNFGIAKLALTYDYPIVPAQFIRTEGSNFKVVFYPPLPTEGLPNNMDSYYKIMTMVNQHLEKWIRQYPHQWLCFHRRWD